MNHPHSLQRWPEKPTSGRYVYRALNNLWHWQCDLCGAPSREFGATTMQDAFALAKRHAEKVCRGQASFYGEPTA